MTVREIALTSVFSLAVGTFSSASFVTAYLPIPIFFILLVVYKLVKKTKIVKYEDMDFVTGCSADIPIDVSSSHTPSQSSCMKIF